MISSGEFKMPLIFSTSVISWTANHVSFPVGNDSALLSDARSCENRLQVFFERSGGEVTVRIEEVQPALAGAADSRFSRFFENVASSSSTGEATKIDE